jgi:hypothetical protein
LAFIKASLLHLAKCKQAGNPRYLQTLLEDISIWGQFEELDQRITRNLSAKNAAELYERVLDRLETDYDKENTGTVKFFMVCYERFKD